MGRDDVGTTHPSGSLKDSNGERVGWLDKFIDEYRRASFNPELFGHETRAINLFLDNLEKARREARQ